MFAKSLIISAILVVLIDYVYLNMVTGFFGKQIRDVQGSPTKVDLLLVDEQVFLMPSYWVW